MKLTLSQDALSKYLIRQLDNFFPDGVMCSGLKGCMKETLERLEHCFSAINVRYFERDGHVFFNHLHSDHYAMFLYFLSNTLYKREEDIRICEKVFFLNKALHGIDAFYSVPLPEIFLFSHPVGTVLGRAQYGNYFLVLQNCVVGGNHGVDYPVLGENVALYKGASIIGKCRIYDNCKISAHSLILDRDLGPNEIYIGDPRNPIIKECRRRNPVWKT